MPQTPISNPTVGIKIDTTNNTYLFSHNGTPAEFDGQPVLVISAGGVVTFKAASPNDNVTVTATLAASAPATSTTFAEPVVATLAGGQATLTAVGQVTLSVVSYQGEALTNAGSRPFVIAPYFTLTLAVGGAVPSPDEALNFGAVVDVIVPGDTIAHTVTTPSVFTGVTGSFLQPSGTPDTLVQVADVEASGSAGYTLSTPELTAAPMTGTIVVSSTKKGKPLPV